ncbi:MAG: TRAP transporter small permease subunit [Pseudomonadales bacterium]
MGRAILVKTLHSIDRFTQVCGRGLAWLLYAMMLITCAVVTLRYGFSIGSIALQESVIYLHGLVFMLGAAYALQRDAHVRVDIFYRNFSPRRKALVNLLGTLVFLLPVCVFIIYVSWNYVDSAWSIRETSVESQGIAAVFLLKTLIPLMAVLLLVQAVAEIIRNALRLSVQD